MFSSLKSITKKKEKKNRRNIKEKNRYYINKISQHTETLTYSQTVTLKQKLKVTVSFYKKKRNNTTKVYIYICLHPLFVPSLRVQRRVENI